MQRVMVIGPCGAGKSTAGFELAKLTGLPLHHMDRLGWNPGWVETDDETLRQRVIAVAAEDRWIIEGNYGGTMELRLPRADTVIYLDYPITLCLFRIIRRILHYRGTNRPDMSAGCPERLDLAFLWYVARWNTGPKLRTEAKLVDHEEKVLRFTSPRKFAVWFEEQG